MADSATHDHATAPDEGATRREFIVQAAEGASCAMFIFATGASCSGGDTARGPEEPRPLAMETTYDPEKHRYVYLIDVSKCIGCGSCVRACEAENRVPEGFFRTWVERYMVTRSGRVDVDSPNGARDGFEPVVTHGNVSKAFFVPKLCNHCTQTPCVQLCPVGASFRSPDGLILVDEDRCIGCSYCVQACPYGSRFIHPETHVATKCTFCYHRITKGLEPACVQVCPTGARRFGDTKKVGDEVTDIIATSKVHVLKPDLQTEPNCYYMGLTKEVR